MKDIIICDIDGTVADLRHRLHHIQGKHKDYDKFYDLCAFDALIATTGQVIQSLARDGYLIVFMSGRPDSHRSQTLQWLRCHLGWTGPLYMRKAGDYRPDHVVKRELYMQMLADLNASTENILCAFDDRPSIVALWRNLGITTYQVSDWDEAQTVRPSVVKPATLTLMVGPSGAGKSTWLAANCLAEAVVSSDALRKQLLGDMLEQKYNDYIFKTLHKLVKTRLDAGLDTCVDATNLRDADRKTLLQLAPKDVIIRYIVLNRSMQEKIATRGWRSIALLERHEQIFKSNLKAILSGDNDPRVQVTDLRT